MSVSGTFVSYDKAASTITLRQDGAKKDSTHAVAKDATVLINSAAAKLADLEAGDSVTLNDDKKATSVSAAR